MEADRIHIQTYLAIILFPSRPPVSILPSSAAGVLLYTGCLDNLCDEQAVTSPLRTHIGSIIQKSYPSHNL